MKGKGYLMVCLGLMAGAACLARTSRADDPADESQAANATDAAPALPSSIVARIDGHPIPYEWFLHEFRSTFFQYEDPDTARRQVFDNFLERMLLYRAAQAEGVPDDPGIREKIDTQIGQMRAFMDYQLAMAEARIVVEAYLGRRGLGSDQFHADEQALAEFIAEVAAVHPEADQPFESLPNEVQAQIRQQVEGRMRRAAIEGLIEELRLDLEVESNLEAIEATPFPEIIRD